MIDTCKFCGSKNLEIEEKRNQTELYCCDCGKWLKSITKEEKRVFLHKSQSNYIEIPKGVTNGDVIKIMFPNIEIEGIWGDPIKSIAVQIGFGTSYFALDWWNTQYKRGIEE